MYNKMAKILSARNFQYKIVKSVLLSILIPAAVILFSSWYFFGGITIKHPVTTTTTTTAVSNKIDLCKGMTKDKCKPDACIWDATQNTCLAHK